MIPLFSIAFCTNILILILLSCIFSEVAVVLCQDRGLVLQEDVVVTLEVIRDLRAVLLVAAGHAAVHGKKESR